MKKAIIGALLVVFIIGGALLTRSYLRVRPMLNLLSARNRIVIAQKLEEGILNKAPLIRAHGDELSYDDVTRFASVEERVDAAIGADYTTFASQAASLEALHDDGKPVSALDVLKGLAPVSGAFLKAREAQVSALNEARFSKEEYDWVKARVYAAAGPDLAHVSLQSVLDDPDLAIRVRIVREHLQESTPDLNRQSVQPYLSKIARWRALAFFDL